MRDWRSARGGWPVSRLRPRNGGAALSAVADTDDGSSCRSEHRLPDCGVDARPGTNERDEAALLRWSQRPIKAPLNRSARQPRRASIPLPNGVRRTLTLDLLEPFLGASVAAIAHHVCSVATEVYHQLLGQDLHLLDDDAFHRALTNY